MESLAIAIAPDKYDETLKGTIDAPNRVPVLAEVGGSLDIFVKPGALVSGKAGLILTFLVVLPDGTVARAQAATTAHLLETAGRALKGWREGGHI